MEPRFGHDFGHVRVHTDAQAADSAHAVHAHAYTVGQNVVFSESNYAPSTLAGRKLLAHELAIRSSNGMPAERLLLLIEMRFSKPLRMPQREVSPTADMLLKPAVVRAANSAFPDIILAGKIVCGRPDTAGK